MLGAVMLNEASWPIVAERLKSSDFFRAAHKLIYEAMLDLSERRVAIDLLTLRETLLRAGKLDDVGGPAYIAKLVDGVPRSTNVQHYADIVRDRARARAGIELAEWMRAEFMSLERPSEEVIGEATGRLLLASESRRSGEGLANDEIQSHAERLVKEETVPAIPTGFNALDKLIGGVRKKDMIIVAGRPSGGKTALALAIGDYTSRSGYVTLFATLEMSKRKLAARMLGWRAGVSNEKLEKREATDADWTNVIEAVTSAVDAPYLWSEDARTIEQLWSWVRRVKAERHRTEDPTSARVDVLILDYIQLMEGARRYSNREAEVAAFSRSVKALAKEEDLALIALAQLKRPEQGKSDKRPRMSDLRESGALEQDADQVLLVHREEQYNPNDDNAGLAEIIVAKNRDGPVGSVRLYFDKDLALFKDPLI